MQEQINEKTVALSVKGAKITGRLLAKAMQAFLNKARASPKAKSGNQSIKSLTNCFAADDEPHIESHAEFIDTEIHSADEKQEQQPTDKKRSIGDRIAEGNEKVRAYKEQQAQNPANISKNKREDILQ